MVFFPGGFVNSSYDTTNVVEIFNTTSQSWIQPIQLSISRAQLSGIEFNGLLYFIGGSTGSSVYNIIDIYDINSNSWTNSTLSTPRAGLGSGVSNNQLVISNISTTNGTTPSSIAQPQLSTNLECLNNI